MNRVDEENKEFDDHWEETMPDSLGG